MSSPLLHHLESNARRGGVAAIESSDHSIGRELTWDQLFASAAALANTLRSRLGPGSVVLLVAANRSEYLVAFHGCLLADMMVFPLSPALTMTEWSEAAQRSGAAACIGDERACAAMKSIVSFTMPLSGLRERSETTVKRHEGAGAMLLQSSGTTGLPKIVRRSLSALIAVGENCREVVGLHHDDRMLTVIPVCHSYGIDHALMAAALAGCTVELCNGFDVQHVRQRLLSGEPTIFPAVPFIFDALAQTNPMRSPLPALRRAFSAGSTMPMRVFERFHAAFDVPVGQIYGSTEFGSVTYNDPYASPFDPLSAGRAMAGVTLKAAPRDSTDPRVALPAGEEGQIWVGGPSMFEAYVGQRSSPLVDGLFPSGDLGRIDAHGRLTITGRIKLLIDVGGLKVNPLEVEEVLGQHPDVKQIVVVAAPVTDTVNRVKAIVVWREAGGSVEHLLGFARERLAPYKVPRFVEERSSLPTTPTGKILRQAVMSA